MPKISKISCHKVLNSRAQWTISTRIDLDDGSFGVQTVPEGASKGEREAISLPADRAVEAVTNTISNSIIGSDAEDQEAIDNKLVELDGTPTKSNLGGNSVLSVSLALARAVAFSKKMELYDYISVLYSGSVVKYIQLPTPVFNVINGGKHAQNNLSFQEFMIIPASNVTFDRKVEMGVQMYNDLKVLLKSKGKVTSVGDEGGFAPEGINTHEALELLREAVSKTAQPGKEILFGMDVAAESFYENSKYHLKEENKTLTNLELANYYADLIKKFEIIYLEDGFYENDTEGWKHFYNEFNQKLMVVADDLVVTNHNILKEAIDNKLANAVIVKPNQVGTLTETLKFIKMAKGAKMSLCVSHRSGETAEDTFIADLSVAVEAEFIKSGAPARGERVAKYNRLLDIYNKSL